MVVATENSQATGYDCRLATYCRPALTTTPRSAQIALQPIAYSHYRTIRLVPVKRDVLTGDIRAELLVSIRFLIEDEALLPFLAGITEPLRAEKEAEFQWHVEAGEIRVPVEVGAGEVVYAESACRDDLGDFSYPHDARIHSL